MLKNGYSKRALWFFVSKTKLVTLIYKYRNSYRLRDWRGKEFQFIHIPKCAGTSIVKSLGVIDPGHYTYSDLVKMKVVRGDEPVIVVVRDPVDRIISTYNYAKKAQKKNGPNPLSWIAKYHTLNDFVLKGLNERNVKNNYFLMPCYSYIEGCNKDNINLINFDNLQPEFEEMANNLGLQYKPLTKENSSERKKEPMSQEVIAKLRKLYFSDYERLAEYIRGSW